MYYRNVSKFPLTVTVDGVVYGAAPGELLTRKGDKLPADIPGVVNHRNVCRTTYIPPKVPVVTISQKPAKEQKESKEIKEQKSANEGGSSNGTDNNK